MTQEERESIIEQLVLVTGHSRKMYEKLKDQHLEMELKQLYEE